MVMIFFRTCLNSYKLTNVTFAIQPMIFSKADHNFRYGQMLVYLFFIFSWFLSSPAAAQEPAAPLCARITATLADNLRAVPFDKVAIFPFEADDPELSATFTTSFFTALSSTKKYKLLPLETVAGWQHTGEANDNSLRQIAGNFGRALNARGVVYATVHANRAMSLDKREPVTSLAIQIRMTDTKTGNTAWSLDIKCKGGHFLRQINITQASRIMEQSLQVLIRQMVKEGDIFSPMLPPPQVISSRGDLRKIRVVLQPDPQYIYSTYQLLTADNPRGVFTPHSPPVKNDQGPIILEETHLEDGKHYYCTAIGITREGLANIPEHPFVVTTSGAPKPLPFLQASGNNLRHIQLLWAPSQDPNVTGYTIYRSTTPDGPFVKIADIPNRRQQNYTDYGQDRSNYYGSLADDAHYFYTIRTRNKFGIESRGAPVVSAHTKGAPLPPTEIQAIGNQPGKIPLFWVPGEDPDIKGYAIFRKDGQEKSFQQIDFVSGRETQKYTDTGSWATPLKNNVTYSYQIRSINVLDLSSDPSRTVSATTKPAPAAVKGIRVSNNQFRQVYLSWQPNPENDILAYEILRGRTSDDLHKIARINAPETSYTDDDLQDGSTYWYQVLAIDTDQLSGSLFSPVSATTKPPPRPPQGISIQISPKGLQLNWQKNKEQDIDHYEISSGGFISSRLGESQNPAFLYEITPKPEKTYTFQVRAVDKDGLTSSWSQQVQIRIPLARDLGKEKK